MKLRRAYLLPRAGECRIADIAAYCETPSRVHTQLLDPGSKISDFAVLVPVLVLPRGFIDSFNHTTAHTAGAMGKRTKDEVEKASAASASAGIAAKKQKKEKKHKGKEAESTAAPAASFSLFSGKATSDLDDIFSKGVSDVAEIYGLVRLTECCSGFVRCRCSARSRTLEGCLLRRGRGRKR